MLPTLRQLQYLKLLADHGSFSRAANAAFVTQPTLSAGIQELERNLGAPVVDRARSGVILTAVGEETVRRAEDVLTRVEDLVQAARSAGQPLCGRFRLGVIPTIAPFLLPKALPALKSRFPKLRLFLREDLTSKLAAGLKTGALDAALIALPSDVAGLETVSVRRDELLAASSKDHPFARAQEVNPDAMQGEDVILLEDGHCLREHALAACGLEPPRGSAEEGAFAATSLHTPGADGGVRARRLAAARPWRWRRAWRSRPRSPCATSPPTRPHREIVVAWRKGSSREHEARLIAETLRDV